jgi:hypothetical protein
MHQQNMFRTCTPYKETFFLTNCIPSAIDGGGSIVVIASVQELYFKTVYLHELDLMYIYNVYICVCVFN